MPETQGNNLASIVVIDDDPLFRSEIESILDEEKLPWTSFESASHAIRHMQEMPWSWIPKLVITDLVMDGMGGYQLIRRVAELFPGKNIPIIVVSRLYSADYVYEAEVAGASCFLQKPIASQKLVSTIKRMMRRQ